MAILLPSPLPPFPHVIATCSNASAGGADVVFPISIHRHHVLRSSHLHCQLSDHQSPPLPPFPPSRTGTIDRSLLNVSESSSEAELWAASCLRVRTFYEFNEQTFGIEDHKRYLAEREFEALKERVAGKRVGFRRVACINATLPMSLVLSVSQNLCNSCQFSHDGEDRVVVGTLDLNQCIGLPDEIVGMRPKANGNDVARAYLSNVCVSKELHRNGLGYELMAKSKNVAENWGISDLYVHVAVNNEAANKLYTRSGFTLESDEPAWRAQFLDRPRRLLLWTGLPIKC